MATLTAKGGYWKFPQAGIVEIGDDVEIGANATIDRGSLDDTRIAEGVKLDNLVHVGHNCQIGAHTVIAAQTGISGSSVLGNHVVVGGQVGIAEHCTLEDHSIAGAQAGIATGKTIRSGQMVWGTPARPLDKFKEQYAWFARLPELAARIKKLETETRGQAWQGPEATRSCAAMPRDRRWRAHAQHRQDATGVRPDRGVAIRELDRGKNHTVRSRRLRAERT